MTTLHSEASDGYCCPSSADGNIHFLSKDGGCGAPYSRANEFLEWLDPQVLSVTVLCEVCHPGVPWIML